MCAFLNLILKGIKSFTTTTTSVLSGKHVSVKALLRQQSENIQSVNQTEGTN